ncbi:MAG: winged helix-turn-helix domain-containing protein [Methanothrix sp.]
MMGWKMAKRSKHTIISQILGICRDGASKTRIVYQANLNFRTVNPYIELLIKNNLIETKQGNKVLYKTTKRGEALREDFEQIENQLAEIL